MTRLFFDEPLSEALCTTLADNLSQLPTHSLLRQGGVADATVWDLARQHWCLVVSQDEDFHRMAVSRGAPPNFVWVRLGNCTTDDIAQLLRRHYEDTIPFDDHNEATVLELG
jgi:predicted nuclease of predicted toxin-antitoxin system